MLLKSLKFLLSFALAPVVLAFMQEAFTVLAHKSGSLSTQLVLAGATSYSVLCLLLYGNKHTFFEIFEHELGHAVTGLVMFRNVREFFVNPDKESHVLTEGVFGGFLVTLAPYYLPVFTIPLLVIRLLIFPSIRPYIDFLVGASLGFHYIGLLKEFSGKQTDIQKNTLLFSFLVTCLMNAVILVTILCLVTEDCGPFLDYIGNSVARSKYYYDAILQNMRPLWPLSLIR